MKSSALRDIHGPVALPGDWWWLWFLAVLAAVVLGSWAILRLLRKFRRSLPQPEPIPPWEKALAQSGFDVRHKDAGNAGEERRVGIGLVAGGVIVSAESVHLSVHAIYKRG